MSSTDRFDVPRLRFTLQQAAVALAISERTAWRLVASGKLPVQKDGRRTFVARGDLERYAAGGMNAA